MLTLVRTGAECIALTATSELSEIRHKLSHWGIRISMGAEEALGRYGAARRLIFFKARPEESLGISSAVEIYVSENSLEMLLASFINSGIRGIENVCALPGIIMVRLMGDIMKGIKALQKDIGGEIINRDPLFRADIPGTASIIYFTPYSLAKTIAPADMYPKALLIYTMSKDALIQYLSVRGAEYLGISMGTPDWNTAEIKICDSDKLFELQHERLITAIQGLQAGLVLEEKWEMEQALAHRALPVYSVKLFTPLDIDTVKKIAMGLEYNKYGDRFVDMDVYQGKKKISAFTQIEKNPGMTRMDIGMENRTKMMKHMDFNSIRKMTEVEDKIELENKKPPEK